MALIKCPECGHDVSDQAHSCPHCGLDVKTYCEDNKRKQEIDKKYQELQRENDKRHEERVNEIKHHEREIVNNSDGSTLRDAYVEAIIVAIIATAISIILFRNYHGTESKSHIYAIIITIILWLRAIIKIVMYDGNGDMNKDLYVKKSNIEMEYDEKTRTYKSRCEEEKSNVDTGKVKCPHCGSTQIETGQKGYTMATGFIGSNQTMNRCAKCGYKWKP